VIESEEFEFLADRPVGDPIDPLQCLWTVSMRSRSSCGNGGDEFVAEHDLIAWPLGLHLEYLEKWYSAGPLLWRGTFSDRASLDSEGIRIDANSGEPVD
jgi:hypothetical protein